MQRPIMRGKVRVSEGKDIYCVEAEKDAEINPQPRAGLLSSSRLYLAHEFFRRAAGNDPPSITNSDPVMKLESSEQK